MPHSKLLTLIVMSLAAPICRSALSEEIELISEKSYTEEEEQETVTNYTFLKCKCLLHGLSHMQLVLSAFSDQSNPSGLLLGTIIWYNGREVISMLYNLPDVKIGSLWPLHLYTGLLRSYYITKLIKGGRSDEKDIDLGKTIFAIHCYVTGKLQADWNATDCPNYKLNDWYHQWLEQNPNADLHKIQEVVRKNNVEFQSFSNKIKRTMSLKEYLMTEKLNDSLKIKNLFLNDFSKRFYTSYVFMNSYDLGIDWTGVKEIIKEVGKHALRPTWNIDNLLNIKLFYKTHFDFFKVIFFRLTWKYLLYIEVLERVSFSYLLYAQEWRELLEKFGKMLRIENDPHIDYLLKAFDKLANRHTSVVDVINVLKVILEGSAKSLKCKATNRIVLSQSIVKRFLQVAVSTKNEQFEISSKISANNFIKKLKLLFIGVDFGVIGSLLEYIDEINPGSKTITTLF